MRPDMHKVIVEEPRHGGGPGKNRRRANLPEELLPKKEGIRRPHTNLKRFGEHLGPLKRWLRSSVGRPWNDVYSEAAKVITADSPVRAHIRVHMFQMVQRYTFMRDGEIWCFESSRWSSGRQLPVAEVRLGSSWPVFYIHPETGILHEVAARRNKVPRDSTINDRKWLSENLVLQKINGLWFACHLRPFEEGDNGPAFDVVLKRWIGTGEAASFRRATYCYLKRQLSRADLRKNGLKNDLAGGRSKAHQSCDYAALVSLAA